MPSLTEMDTAVATAAATAHLGQPEIRSCSLQPCCGRQGGEGCSGEASFGPRPPPLPCSSPRLNRGTRAGRRPRGTRCSSPQRAFSEDIPCTPRTHSSDLPFLTPKLPEGMRPRVCLNTRTGGQSCSGSSHGPAGIVLQLQPRSALLEIPSQSDP